MEKIRISVQAQDGGCSMPPRFCVQEPEVTEGHTCEEEEESGS
jgi:hypothetical protein